MSGIVLALNPSQLVTVVFAVRVDDNGIFGWGAIPSGGGSITPTTFRAKTFRSILSPSINGGDVGIEMNGTGIPQNFFYDVTLQTKTGTLVTLLSSNSTFSGGSTPLWRWTTAGEMRDATVEGLNRSVTFRYM